MVLGLVESRLSRTGLVSTTSSQYSAASASAVRAPEAMTPISPKISPSPKVSRVSLRLFTTREMTTEPLRII